MLDTKRLLKDNSAVNGSDCSELKGFSGCDVLQVIHFNGFSFFPLYLLFSEKERLDLFITVFVSYGFIFRIDLSSALYLMKLNGELGISAE